MQHPRHSPFANYDITRRREFVIERTAEEEFLTIDVRLPLRMVVPYWCNVIEVQHGHWEIRVYTINMSFSSYLRHYRTIQGGSNMTGTDLCVSKPHCAAAVRP